MWKTSDKSFQGALPLGLVAVLVLLASVIPFTDAALAHGVGEHDQGFLSSVSGVHAFPFMYLGAKHMVTGFDHLLYLVGVIFFLQKPKDVIKFVSLFTLGHSITLLYGVLSGTHINPFIVDAIIGLSVCYKALENLSSKSFFDPRFAVFGFGLVHGFGLSTKLQDLSLSTDGLVANMIYFNIGVEIGQAIALTFLLIALSWLRKRPNLKSISINTNVVLFGAGLILFGMQIAGLIIE